MFQDKFSFFLVVGFLLLNAIALISMGASKLQEEVNLVYVIMIYVGLFLSWCLVIMIIQRYSNHTWGIFVKTKLGINIMKISCVLAIPGLVLIEIISSLAFSESISKGITVNSLLNGLVTVLILAGIGWVVKKFFSLMYAEAIISESNLKSDGNDRDIDQESL